MKPARLALLALVSFAPLVASAQWMWLDNGGHKVFSDRAPPADIPANHILRQPAGARLANVDAAAAVPTSAPASATTTANPPKVTGRDPALEEKRKQVEAAQAEKAKAEEEKVAAARADNCRRAQQGKAQIDSGMRIARINAKGEQEIMDDAQRQAEGRRLADVIARDCTPAH
jgi:hypothetical protein